MSDTSVDSQSRLQIPMLICRFEVPKFKLPIVFASRIPSRPLRLGDLGSGAWRLGDLEASFIGG